MRERWKEFGGTNNHQHSRPAEVYDHSAVGGNANWCSHYGELYGASLKGKQTNKKPPKNRTTIYSCNPTPGHISRENRNSKRYIHNVHRSTTYNRQDTEATKSPSTDE